MRLDPFTSVLIVVVALASFFPCEGQVAVWFGLLTKLAVALLFFMHGAKLSRQNLLAGLGHWRLHLVVMASTSCCSRCWGCCSRRWCPTG